MKATLTYEFNLPEDQHEFDLQTRASAMYSALWQISERLRSELKHAETPMNPEQFREYFWEVVRDYDLEGLEL